MKTILKIVLILSCFGFFSCNKDNDDSNDCGCDKKYGTFLDIRDGREYKTIKIGDQTWMAENLAYLPAISNLKKSSKYDPLYYVYNYSGYKIDEALASTNYLTYGVLYNWPAAMIACPLGWHVPSDGEWEILEIYLIENGYGYKGSGDDIAKSMAATSGWVPDSESGTIGNHQEDNNSSCFSALPGGCHFGSDNFIDIEYGAYWWSSTEYLSFGVYRRVLSGTDSILLRETVLEKSHGYSVRCIKN